MTYISYLHQLPGGAKTLVKDDGYYVIEERLFWEIDDYTKALPPPHPGGLYRQNKGWPDDMEDDWWLFVVERDPRDREYTIHPGLPVKFKEVPVDEGEPVA